MSEISYRERQALSLGATLYVPADHKDLAAITSSNRTGARSLVVCTEDALAFEDLVPGLCNISECLADFMSMDKDGVQVFIRPRNPEVLACILEMPGIENAAGFVLPKFSLANMNDWSQVLIHADPRLGVMPTLETEEAFCQETMRALASKLSECSLANRVIALRIGGNDLLQCLSIRRPRGMTIYDTALGSLISQMVGTFKPKGFHLTAPVFEHFEDTEGLKAELAKDRAHGLVGKTAIHPLQIEIIEEVLSPTESEIDEAMAILNVNARPVFKMNGSMCEVATHSRWAQHVLYMANRKALRPALRSVA